MSERHAERGGKKSGGKKRGNHSLQKARQKAKKKKLTSRSVVRMSEASRPLCVRGDADGGVFCTKKKLEKLKKKERKKKVNSNSLSESLTRPTGFFFSERRKN
jgi:hypothetical protein